MLLLCKYFNKKIISYYYIIFPVCMLFSGICIIKIFYVKKRCYNCYVAIWEVVAKKGNVIQWEIHINTIKKKNIK